MVVLLNHINLPDVTVAVDGSLYEHHPKYHDHMMDVLRKWVPKTKVSCFIILAVTFEKVNDYDKEMQCRDTGTIKCMHY